MAFHAFISICCDESEEVNPQSLRGNKSNRGFGSCFLCQIIERGFPGIFLLQKATSMHRSGSASTNPYTLPSAPYSRRDALDSYRGNKKLKKKWTHSERTVAVYSIFWQRE